MDSLIFLNKIQSREELCTFNISNIFKYLKIFEFLYFKFFKVRKNNILNYILNFLILLYSILKVSCIINSCYLTLKKIDTN